MIAEYLKAFFVGAALCMIGQVLIDKTRLTPARILTLYVVAGVLHGRCRRDLRGDLFRAARRHALSLKGQAIKKNRSADRFFFRYG